MTKYKLFTRRHILLLVLLPLTVLLLSWGYTGHYKISHDASLSFTARMEQFNAWTSILASHASDADYRKNSDPDEAPRHYINIDDYTGFFTTHRIPQTLDSVLLLYGSYFVYERGILPWATLTTYDSLKNCFIRQDWEKAVLFAADLGHYVADGHMPLHITRNYNGQYSGNYGIHSRYESTMINDNIAQIIYNGDSVSLVPDINQYIFNYIYTNYLYVDSILDADDYAKTFSTSTSSSAYKQALWDYSENFTVRLFKNASHALAELIYNAWVEAGSPPLSASFISTIAKDPLNYIEQIYPNPVVTSTRVTLSLPESTYLTLELRDFSGALVTRLEEGFKSAGKHEITWTPSAELSDGVYYLVLKAGRVQQVKRLMLLNSFTALFPAYQYVEQFQGGYGNIHMLSGNGMLPGQEFQGSFLLVWSGFLILPWHLQV